MYVAESDEIRAVEIEAVELPSKKEGDESADEVLDDDGPDSS